MIVLRKHILKIKISNNQRISKYQAETIMQRVLWLAVQWRHWELSWAIFTVEVAKKNGSFGLVKCDIYIYIYICWALLYVQRNMYIYIYTVY